MAPIAKWQPLTGRQVALPGPKPDEKSAFLGGSLFNRDLSWLNFNDRVLSEAADRSVPPLERLRFATIVSSNLDEFFMVRVGEIASVARRNPLHRFPDGDTARQVLGEIRELVLRQKERQAGVLNEILLELDKSGISIKVGFDADRSLDNEIRKNLPKIEMVARASSEPVPHDMGGGLHVFVRFAKDYAIMRIVDREARLLQLSDTGKKKRYALVERWLSARAQEFFPDHKVIEAFPFKIIRNADLRYHPDDEDTLEEQIAEAVRRRGRARVVRLEVDSPSYSEGALFLASELKVDSSALYRFDLPLDLRTLATICNIEGYRGLRYPAIEPETPPPLRRSAKILETIRKNDILLHHPYDSFDVVVNFVEKAAQDPQVTEIYHMMYRTSRLSPIMEALKVAARGGKKVTAYIEIRARFDELNNIRWADELRKAGVRVVRPMGGYKVHSKLTQVLRKEGDALVSYLHLGTGNYHPTTAKQYTDLGLLTSDPALGQEITAYFDALAEHRSLPKFQHLLGAPTSLHADILRLIREEIAIQKEGGRGHIMAKMNALVDTDIINALYDASAAGVKVELMVRGICSLRPGTAGLSENIKVVSVVDRFLEHSRIYYFESDGKEKVYLASADWMPRNFHQRYEIAFPIQDPVLKKFLKEVILANGLNDNAKGWLLRPDGTYARAVRLPNVKEVRSQFVFESLAREQYKGTILEKRFES